MQSIGNVTEREFESQLESLKKESKIVGLYFKNGEKSIGTSKYFYVKIKHSNDFQLLRNFSSERNVEIISNVPNMPLWYILAVTDSKYTSLEMSNLYYESKLFSNVDPAFIFDFKGECANDPYFKDFGIKQDVFFADLQWETILVQVEGHKVVYQEIAKYPEVRRDLALLLDEKVSFAEVHKVALATEKGLLKHLNLFDVYQGNKLPKGKKSYAVSFVLQDDNKTLTDKQIDKTMQRLQEAFEKQLGATLRE